MSPEVAKASPTLLAAIVESSGDAIVCTTVDGIVTVWNPAAERMFGYTAAEVIDRPIFTIIPPPLVDKGQAGMEERRLRVGPAAEYLSEPTMRGLERYLVEAERRDVVACIVVAVAIIATELAC